MTTIIPVSPGEMVMQAPRTAVLYELTPEVWGSLEEEQPSVVSVRPIDKDHTLHVTRARLKPSVVLHRQGHGTTAARVPREQMGACLVVAGGIAGARYEIRLTPKLAFQVRVTVAAVEDNATTGSARSKRK